MTSRAKHRGLQIGGALLGAVGGFLYYKFVGCASGTCPLTSEPFFPAAWGALFGWLLFGPGPKKTVDTKAQAARNDPLEI
ncbi:MAG: DUF6132 family protein [bacterium]